MGKEKGGFLTPKAIANRIKAKGLQKLRWYCQMCQKQCRDENGFKCHCMSESHQRQLLLFAENPDKYLDSFSKEFMDDFLALLRRRFGTKRVHCNIVYQEYISDRDHTHMNSTQWETLTEFVKWLGREGHCVVDETPKGWYITYIDRDYEAIEKQKAAASKEKSDLDDQERMAIFLEQQIQRAKETEKDQDEPTYTDLRRENEGEKVQLNLFKAGPSNEKPADRLMGAANLLNADMSSKKTSKSTGESRKSRSTKRKSALEEIIEEEKAKKSKPPITERLENWVQKGLIVKVITKRLGEKYYKKKGEIVEVKNLFVAVVELLDSGEKLKLDQSHIETVIPALGKSVMIVNGEHRGKRATLIDLQEKTFSVVVRIEEGPLKGKTVRGVSYEDVCKLAAAD